MVIKDKVKAIPGDWYFKYTRCKPAKSIEQTDSICEHSLKLSGMPNAKAAIDIAMKNAWFQRERSFIYEARSIVGRGYGIKVVLLMRSLTDTLKNIWMQFWRTKCAKRQLEGSKVKFCRMINFFFTFGKAISNSERPGQHKSDPFTTDKLYTALTTKLSRHFHRKIKFSFGPSEATVLLRAHLNTNFNMTLTEFNYEVTWSQPQACEETEEDPDTFGCLVLVCDRRQTAGLREDGEWEKEKEGSQSRERGRPGRKTQREQNTKESRAMKVTENERQAWNSSQMRRDGSGHRGTWRES